MINTSDNLFANQTAIITGGLGDIGRATALEFAKHGAAIALCDLKPEDDAVEFLNTLRSIGVACTYQQVDVSDANAVQAWIDETENSLGTPSLIIANAAMATLASILDITPQQWSKEMSVNLHGAFYCSQHAARRLREKNLPGRIVFVGSWAGSSVHQHVPAYSVSKAALNMLCKCLALELAPHKILVNEIAPGYVNAGLSGKLWQDNPSQFEKSREQVPIKKIMTAQVVAEQILYLCHPQNEHITGASLLVDGGLSLR